MIETTFIYALRCPVTGEIRYIGKSDDPQRRLSAHIAEAIANQNKSHRVSWLQALLAEDLKPMLELVDEVLRSEWQAAEAAYIIFFKEQGCRLVNNAPGGEGFGSGKDHVLFGKTGESHPWFGKKHSAKSRYKMSASRTGEKNPHFGKPRPPETKSKVSAALKGRTLSSEHCGKMSAAVMGEKNPHFGKPRPTETRVKISAALKGKRLSPEHRAKLSLSHKGSIMPDATRKKISNAHKGKVLSQKIRLRMKEASAKRWKRERESRRLNSPQLDLFQRNAVLGEKHGIT